VDFNLDAVLLNGRSRASVAFYNFVLGGAALARMARTRRILRLWKLTAKIQQAFKTVLAVTVSKFGLLHHRVCDGGRSGGAVKKAAAQSSTSNVE
jgi:hypothetical protein